MSSEPPILPLTTNNTPFREIYPANNENLIPSKDQQQQQQRKPKMLITRAILIGSDLAKSNNKDDRDGGGIDMKKNIKVVTDILQNFYNLNVFIIQLRNRDNTSFTPEFEQLKDSEDALFVLNNFEGFEFREIHDKVPHYRLISLQAILMLCKDKDRKPLPPLKEKRPLYSFHLANMVFGLEIPKHMVKRIVDLIHFMNGCVRREFKNTFILIANEVRGENYRTAVSVQSRVLTSEYIETCWENRNNPHFHANFPELMKQYALKCFSGLILYIQTDNPTEYVQCKQETKKNGGITTNKISEATHIVICQQDHTSREELRGASPIAHFVTLQWFWKSIHCELCYSESLFNPFDNPTKDNTPKKYTQNPRRSYASPAGDLSVKSKSRKSRSRSNFDTSKVSSEYMYSDDDELEAAAQPPPPPKQNIKRYQVCMEMIETEQNYIASLELMLTSFKQPLEDALLQDIDHNTTLHGFSPAPTLKRPILNKLQISKIFGKIQPILNVHRNILSSLEAQIKSWDTHYSEVKIGYVWAIHGPELKKVYPPFVNDYDSAREYIDECMINFPKFMSFVKQVESDPKCRKMTLKDLLIKPVQRLPSVGLLLTQILKHTDKALRDYECLIEAINAINAVNCETNKSRDKTETCKDFFNVANQIEGYPDVLIHSNRTFHKSIEVTILSGDGIFSDYRGKTMSIFLFNDFVAFTKNRTNASNQTLTSSSSFSRGTLSRQMSFLASARFRERKKYKLILLSRMPDFRLVRYERRHEFFVVKIRNEESEYLFTAHPSADINFSILYEFFKELCNLYRKFSGKDMPMEELTPEILKDIQYSACEDYSVIGQAIDTISSSNGATPKRRSTLRRTVSNLSQGITHGLQRMASRATLMSSINESP